MLLSMARAVHCTVRAVTATGRFTLLFVFNQFKNNQKNYYCKYKYHNNCSYIFSQPRKHSKVSFQKLNFFCKFCCFGILLEEEHINNQSKCRNGKDKSDNVNVSGEESAELIYHK